MPAATRKTTPEDPRRRAIAWRLAAQAAVCDRLEPVEHGTLIGISDVPGYWDYNLLRVDEPTEATAEELAAAADALQGDLAHRRVQVLDEASGARLADGFAALGWKAFRHIWMLHAPSQDPGERDPAVEQVPARMVADLNREWLGSEPWMGGDAAAGRFANVQARADARLPGTMLTLAVFDPWPVGFVALRQAVGAAEITELYVTPSHRRRGLSGALLRSAMATARAEGIGDLWIVADEDDWPKTLYERAGFGRVWLEHLFTRLPA